MDYTSFYRFAVSGTGNNQPILETASMLKTSKSILSYNQPILETNRQYWGYCNYKKIIYAISTITDYSGYISRLYRKKQKKARK